MFYMRLYLILDYTNIDYSIIHNGVDPICPQSRDPPACVASPCEPHPSKEYRGRPPD